MDGGWWLGDGGEEGGGGGGGCRPTCVHMPSAHYLPGSFHANTVNAHTPKQNQCCRRPARKGRTPGGRKHVRRHRGGHRPPLLRLCLNPLTVNLLYSHCHGVTWGTSRSLTIYTLHLFALMHFRRRRGICLAGISNSNPGFPLDTSAVPLISSLGAHAGLQ